MAEATTSTIHDCPLCTCGYDPDDLSPHCEEHFLVAGVVGHGAPCRFCPITLATTMAHHLELDYDGQWYCPGCVTEGNCLKCGGRATVSLVACIECGAEGF